MAEVVTFLRYRPPARFDSLPWTEVRIEESATEDGTYTQIDAIALSPLDADPSDPAFRSFTTELGTALEYWYRILFADASGDISQPTTPIQNLASLAVPDVLAYATTNELARILKIRTPTAEQNIAMQRVLDAAALEIDAELGRVSPYDDPPALVVEVNLNRAVELWHQEPIGFNVVGLDSEAPVRLGSNSWVRYANQLAPLKETWGLA
jgi:hypothetical protein